MDRECCNVDRMSAFNHLARRVNQNQVGDPDPPEVHAERVYPEVIRPFRIARRNVSCRAFVETELGKKAEGRSQALFAVSAFLFDSCESGNRGDSKDVSRCSHHTSPPSNSLGGL
jgi:hypothetical protein